MLINARNEEINLKTLKNQHVVSYFNVFQELDSFFTSLEYCEVNGYFFVIKFFDLKFIN